MGLMERAREAEEESKREAIANARRTWERECTETRANLYRLLKDRLGVDSQDVVMNADEHWGVVAEVELYRFATFYPEDSPDWPLFRVEPCEGCGALTLVPIEITELRYLAMSAAWLAENQLLCAKCDVRDEPQAPARICPLMAIANQHGRLTDTCEQERCAWWYSDWCGMKGLAAMAYRWDQRRS